jgi:uridine kinase
MEQLFVESGAIRVEIGAIPTELQEHILGVGDTLLVPSSAWHRVSCQGESTAVVTELMEGEHKGGEYIIERAVPAVPERKLPPGAYPDAWDLLVKSSSENGSYHTVLDTLGSLGLLAADCVGIDGPTGVGKSGFAAAMIQWFRKHRGLVGPWTPLRLDWFIRAAASRRPVPTLMVQGQLDVKDYSMATWDIEAFLNTFRRMLDERGARPVAFTLTHMYSRITEEHDATVKVDLPEGAPLIVEGVGVFQLPMSEHFDLRVRLDVACDATLVGRKILREENKPRRTPMTSQFILERYFTSEVFHTHFLRAATHDRVQYLLDVTDFDRIRLFRRRGNQ